MRSGAAHGSAFPDIPAVSDIRQPYARIGAGNPGRPGYSEGQVTALGIFALRSYIENIPRSGAAVRIGAVDFCV